MHIIFAQLYGLSSETMVPPPKWCIEANYGLSNPPAFLTLLRQVQIEPGNPLDTQHCLKLMSLYYHFL